MRKTLTLILIATSSYATWAQCTASVPSIAIVYTIYEPEPLLVNDSHFWVCNGGDILVAGNNNTLYVEPGGFGNVIGTGNTIYSNGNATAIDGANTIYIHDMEAFTGTEEQIVTECPGGIVMDYTNAPAGCSPTSNIAEMEIPVQLEISPNPMFDHLNILVDDQTRVQHVRLMDINGRLVLQEAGRVNMKVNVGGLNPGLFIALVETDRGTLMRKVRKE
jgi:hypothetical protein